MLETEVARLTAVRAALRLGDQSEFGSLTEPYRRELLTHCYRMLGSLQDAEDLVQETFLRAWRRLDTFERHVSFRAWLYKIATNACLDFLATSRRPGRTLPSTAYPAAEPHAPMAPTIDDPVWLDPCPDEWRAPASAEADPEARYSARESVTLAFVTALQTLPPRQRAVLILRDVLDWRAAEAAELLGFTVSAVNSTLHRARRTLARHYHRHQPGLAPLEDAPTRALLKRYLRAWEAADVKGLVALLKEEATFVMPPWPTWYRGRAAIQAFFVRDIFANVAPGHARLQPLRANGQPGFALYHRDATRNVYNGFAIKVLTLDPGTGLIADIIAFVNPKLFPAFGLPTELKA